MIIKILKGILYTALIILYIIFGIINFNVKNMNDG